jgi:hypothetical protein
MKLYFIGNKCYLIVNLNFRFDNIIERHEKNTSYRKLQYRYGH